MVLNNKQEDVTFVIMGGSGDLTKRKIIPAIYNLIKEKKINKFTLILTGHTLFKSNQILSKAKKFIKSKKINKSVWTKLENNSTYHQIDFNNQGDFIKLERAISRQEEKLKLKGNRLFYLATYSQYYKIIAKYLKNAGSIRHKKKSKKTKSKEPWSRIALEKPFGEDYSTAKAINKALKKSFTEQNIYRVDHYLEKELVSNIALLRFTNIILEPLWNYNHVDHVQVIIDEDIDIQGRAAFYDSQGAIKDVIQNHALQLLALTCMDAPKSLKGNEIRNKKSNFLGSLEIDESFFAQYQGYKKEAKNNNSSTDTFAVIKLKSKSRRWKNTPLYVRSGKALKNKKTRINIIFKRVKCLLDTCPREPNHLSINIHPKNEVHFHLNSKIPNSHDQVTPVKLTFKEDLHFGINTIESYQTILTDMIEGDQSHFVNSDEIEHSWKLIDKIQKTKKKQKLHIYKKKATEPKDLKQWSKQNKVDWIL